MQELTTPVPLTSPYTSADGVTMPTAPRLGTPVPGTTGGLPAQQGLNVYSNPLAQQLQSNPDNFNPSMQTSQQPSDQYGAQQAPSAYPQELPLSREQAQSRQDQQPMQGYAHGGVAHSAEKIRSHGRGDDTMLVHMTPEEVNSLQGLAMATGGTLTINPHTGLPEAGWLGKLLPMIAGIGLNFLLPGSGIVASLGGKAATAGLLTGLAGTAITGDIQKGLAAGLGAFGGASLAGGIQGALGGATKAAATTAPASSAVTSAAEKLATQQAGQLANIGTQVGKLGTGLGGGSAMGMGMNAVAPELVRDVAPNIVKGLGGFTQGFANTAKGTLGKVLSKAAVPAALMGVTGTLSNAMTPTGGYTTAQGTIDNSYQGPYTAQRRTPMFAPSTADLLASTKERRYFDVSMPEVYNMQGQVVQPGSNTAFGTPILQSVLNPNPKKGQPMYSFVTNRYMMSPEEQQAAMYGQGYNEGGEVELAPGSFIVDARTVSEGGEGDGEAGKNAFRKLGGIPIEGPGDGVSDSIPARIGDQPARVASGEVYMPPEAVRRIGKGDEKRGAQKLYAMMDRAHQATKRGQKRNILKGLA